MAEKIFTKDFYEDEVATKGLEEIEFDGDIINDLVELATAAKNPLADSDKTELINKYRKIIQYCDEYVYRNALKIYTISEMLTYANCLLEKTLFDFYEYFYSQISFKAVWAEDLIADDVYEEDKEINSVRTIKLILKLNNYLNSIDIFAKSKDMEEYYNSQNTSRCYDFDNYLEETLNRALNVAYVKNRYMFDTFFLSAAPMESKNRWSHDILPNGMPQCVGDVRARYYSNRKNFEFLLDKFFQLINNEDDLNLDAQTRIYEDITNTLFKVTEEQNKINLIDDEIVLYKKQPAEIESIKKFISGKINGLERKKRSHNKNIKYLNSFISDCEKTLNIINIDYKTQAAQLRSLIFDSEKEIYDINKKSENDAHLLYNITKKRYALNKDQTLAH